MVNIYQNTSSERTCGQLKDEFTTQSEKSLMPIDSDSLVNKIIDRIIQAIVDGTFKVGEKLPSEYELINLLNVGRNSLREAIKILSTLGVVTIKRGDGTYVCSQVSPNAFDSIIYSIIFRASVNKEMLELRKILDREVLQLVIEKASDTEIAELRPFLGFIRAAYEKGEIRHAAYLDNKFHIAIAALSKNPYLAKIVEGVYKIFSLSIEQVNNTVEAFRDTELCHEKTLECLESRDIKGIDAVVESSLVCWNKSNNVTNKNI